jgi:hypothetical protein
LSRRDLIRLLHYCLSEQPDLFENISALVEIRERREVFDYARDVRQSVAVEAWRDIPSEEGVHIVGSGEAAWLTGWTRERDRPRVLYRRVEGDPLAKEHYDFRRPFARLVSELQSLLAEVRGTVISGPVLRGRLDRILDEVERSIVYRKDDQLAAQFSDKQVVEFGTVREAIEQRLIAGTIVLLEVLEEVVDVVRDMPAIADIPEFFR